MIHLAVTAGAHVHPLPTATGLGAKAKVLQVTPLSAHILSQLLFLGGPLLSSCLPPPANTLEALRVSSGNMSASKSQELMAGEAAVGALLRLIPLIAKSAKSFAHELPIEEFLFLVSLAPYIFIQPCICADVRLRACPHVILTFFLICLLDLYYI